MRINFLTILFSTFWALGPNFTTICADLNVPKELVGEGKDNVRGVKARLTQKGVSYMATFLSNLLLGEIVKANVDNQSFVLKINDEKLTVDGISLEIHNSAKNLHTKTKPPHHTLIEIPAMSFTIKSHLQGTINHLNIDTAAQFHSKSSAVLLQVSSEKSPSGSPQYKIEKCEIRPELLDMSFRPDNIPSELKQEVLRLQAEKFSNDFLCHRIIFVLDKKLNERLALLATKLSLPSINDSFIVSDVIRKLQAKRQRRDSSIENGKEGGLFNNFDVSKADDLFLDYSIIEFRGTDAGMEIDSGGEVSFRGRGGTPFGPVELHLPESVNQDIMLQMAVSDFLPNSLMYHGHNAGLFNAKVDSKTPNFGSIMRTSCQSSSALFCLGDFFPTLRRLHPDHKMTLSFSTTQAPVIKFHPPSAGGTTFVLNGRIGLSKIEKNPTNSETLIAEMAIMFSGRLHFRISSTVVRPKITFDSIKLKTLSPEVLLQDELDSIFGAREVLQRMINDVLRNGIPIPVHPLMRLIKPKAKILERAILLNTNIEFNDKMLQRLISASFDK